MIKSFEKVARIIGTMPPPKAPKIAPVLDKAPGFKGSETSSRTIAQRVNYPKASYS